MTWTKTAALTTTVAVLACHRGMVDEPTGSSDESTTSVTSAETEDTGSAASSTGFATESSSGDAFDIMEWVGEYHERPPFAGIGVDWSPGSEYSYIRNIYIYDNYTAAVSYEPCSPTMESNRYDYRIESDGPRSLRLVPSDPWLYVHLTLGPDCNTLLWESAAGTPPNDVRMASLEFDRGSACWMDTCEPPDYRVYPDYCSGEPPPECP